MVPSRRRSRAERQSGVAAEDEYKMLVMKLESVPMPNPTRTLQRFHQLYAADPSFVEHLHGLGVIRMTVMLANVARSVTELATPATLVRPRPSTERRQSQSHSRDSSDRVLADSHQSSDVQPRSGSGDSDAPSPSKTRLNS